MLGYAGLLLDFYGTVVEDDDAIMEAIAATVAARAAKPVTTRQVLAAWEQELTVLAAGPPFHPMRDCVPRSLAAVLAEVDCDGDADVLCAPQLAYWRSPPLRPGTRAFLSRVTLPICVVSDADRDDLVAAMAYHGLAFDAVVASEEVGAYKPDRAMFTRALAALSLGAQDVLHVGDSLDADVRGAHAAGIRAAWVNRHRRGAPRDVPIEFEIADLGGVTTDDLAGTGVKQVTPDGPRAV
jgi:2-haloacid dehalogenase/putative hydrolase of the HAD superfamily